MDIKTKRIILNKARRLTPRQLSAAISAIEAMLAGEENQGDWPEDVSARDLEGASRKLKNQLYIIAPPEPGSLERLITVPAPRPDSGIWNEE